MSLKQKILKEMMISEKELGIRELLKYGHWDESRIRRRWDELEKERCLDNVDVKSEEGK